MSRYTRTTIFLILLISITAFLRLYRLPETIRFFDDQGLDMIIIWNMEHMHHLPLVGPWLSLPNVYTPPTYYYITWFFYHITGSITGIVYGYFIMNMLTSIILIRLAWNIGGQKQSIIMAILLAISVVMTDHGRQFWNPYPMQLFLALWLLFVWHAHTSKRAVMLWMGVLCFQIALSIYPSPIMLIPCVGYQLFHWYRTHKATSPIFYSIGLSGITFISTFLVVFSPQLWFESSHQFPTLNTLITSVNSTPLPNPIFHIWRNVYGIFASFFAVNPTTGFGVVLLSVYIGIFIILLIPSKAIKMAFSPFFSPWCLAAGLIFLLLYTFDIYEHRMWALLPFMFLISSYALSHTIHKNTYFNRILLIAFCIYIATNSVALQYKYLRTSQQNTIEASKAIAKTIKRDMNEQHISQTSTGLAYKVPNDPENGSYAIYRIAYWLLESRTFVFPVTKEGNMTQFGYAPPLLKSYMYVICEGFLSTESGRKQCVEPTVKPHSYQVLKMYNFGKSQLFTIFIDDLSL